MTTYYKAVRLDGTDFRTGTVRYDVGTTVSHPAPHRDDASGYLSVSVSATDCTGMRWPCRLLEVEPTEPWAPNDGSPSKRGCHGLRVVRELDPLLALGPQGVHVAALIERVRALTAADAEQLAAGRAAAWDAAVDAAWAAALDAAWAAGRAAAWDAAWDAARDAAWDAARHVARDAAWDAARDAAWDAARDAALALVVRDLITPGHYRTLTGPWASVIGPAHPDDQEKDNA